MSEGLREAHAGERAAQLDMAEWFGRNVPFVRPMFRLDAVRIARQNEALLRAAAQASLPAAKEARKKDPVLQQVPTPQTTLPRAVTFGGKVALGSTREPVDYTRLLTTDVCSISGLSNGRVVGQNMLVRAEAHLAAASVAVQLYRADHAGAFPPSLGALVPAYLPHAPPDPMSPDGSPIRYVIARGALPGGGNRPLVYSVGPDGGDDTVDASGLTRLPSVPCYGTQRTPDEWRDVSRWLPVKTPAQIKAEADKEKEAEAAATQPAK
jgi:hypothetical protein